MKIMLKRKVKGHQNPNKRLRLKITSEGLYATLSIYENVKGLNDFQRIKPFMFPEPGTNAQLAF